MGGGGEDREGRRGRKDGEGDGKGGCRGDAASSTSASSLATLAGVANLGAVGHLISVVRAGVGAGAAVELRDGAGRVQHVVALVALRKETRSGAVG